MATIGSRTPEVANPPKETTAATTTATSTAATATTAGGGGSRMVTGDGRCSRHSGQFLLLYCCKCEVIICMVCKLTYHDDHKIEDLMDTGKKARAELTEELQAVTQREQVLRAFLAKAEDFEDDIHREKQGLEERLVDRAAELRQMVDRAQAEALETVAQLTHKALKDLQDQVEPMKEKHVLTETQLPHINHVIREGEDTQAITLSAQLKQEARSLADKQRRGELFMVERGTARHEFRVRAVKYTNVLAFMGSAVEGPVIEAKLSSSSGAEGLEVSTRAGSSSQPLCGQRISKAGRSSTPVVIFYSKNPKSMLSTIHVMGTDDDFWLGFNPGGNVPLFGFFDDDGHLKELHSENIPSSTVLLTTDGDTVTSLNNGRWVRPGNQCGSLENFTPWNGTAASKSSTPFLLKQQSIFKLVSTDAVPPQVEAAATFTLDAAPASFDVSQSGEFVAAVVQATVNVYDKLQSSPALRSYADYVDPNAGAPSDVCFCVMEGKELLLVAFSASHTVHVLDHKDGCCFVRALDTEKHPLTSPCRLATNHHGRVWVGCHGGRVVIFEV